MTEKLVQIVTTIGTRDEAMAIGEKAVDSKLAACAQISGPITSIYEWKGESCREEEWVCTMKTVESLSDDLMNFIREIHPYETPEIIAVPVLQASSGYSLWVAESTHPGKHKKEVQTKSVPP